MNRFKYGLLGAGALAAASVAMPAVAQDITIASAGPMTGQYAAFGRSCVAAPRWPSPTSTPVAA